FESPEAHDISLRTDAMLDKLLKAIDQQAGIDNVLYLFTADHGVSPLPEANWARKIPGGRLLAANIKKTVQDALEKRYGAGDWVKGNWDISVFLNRDLIATKRLSQAAVQQEAARALAALPGVLRVYTHDDLSHGRVPNDELSRRVANGFNVKRSPDVEFIPE